MTRTRRTPLLIHGTTPAILASGLALVAVLGCGASEIGGGPAQDELLGADGTVGHGCSSSADCDGALRCLRLAAEQFCVEPCTADAACGDGLCNPIQGSETGWCDFTEGWVDGDDVLGGSVPTPPGPKPPADEPTPVPDPPDDPTDPPDDPTPTPETRPHAGEVPEDTSAPGATCGCDADCGARRCSAGVCVPRDECLFDAACPPCFACDTPTKTCRPLESAP